MAPVFVHIPDHSWCNASSGFAGKEMFPAATAIVLKRKRNFAFVFTFKALVSVAVMRNYAL